MTIIVAQTHGPEKRRVAGMGKVKPAPPAAAVAVRPDKTPVVSRPDTLLRPGKTPVDIQPDAVPRPGKTPVDIQPDTLLRPGKTPVDIQPDAVPRLGKTPVGADTVPKPDKAPVAARPDAAPNPNKNPVGAQPADIPVRPDKKLVEAALFIAGHEMKREELAEMLQITPESVERLVAELVNDYSKRDSSITIIKLANAYKMDIKGQYLDRVRTLAPDMELSRGLLKALSFIAYKQPVRQSELVKLMGNRAYDYVHELVDRGFITAEKYGRTRILNTTDKFRMYFGTSSIVLSELPQK